MKYFCYSVSILIIIIYILNIVFFNFKYIVYNNDREATFRKLANAAKEKCWCSTRKGKVTNGKSGKFKLKTDNITVAVNETLANLIMTVKFLSNQFNDFGKQLR